MTTIRHKLIQDSMGHPVCNCGYAPGMVTQLSHAGQIREVINHVRKSRRWKYLGIEFHYGLGYYIWENELSNKRYAMQEYDFLKLTGVSRHPRLQISWTAPASGVSS